MFTGSFSETSTKEVLLSEVDFSNVDTVLKFVYFGRIETEQFVKNATEASTLFVLADMWNLPKHTRHLEIALLDAVNEGGIDPFEIISFAESHKLKWLYLQSLRRRTEWSVLKERQPLNGAPDDNDADVWSEITDFLHSLL